MDASKCMKIDVTSTYSKFYRINQYSINPRQNSTNFQCLKYKRDRIKTQHERYHMHSTVIRITIARSKVAKPFFTNGAGYSYS